MPITLSPKEKREPKSPSLELGRSEKGPLSFSQDRSTNHRSETIQRTVRKKVHITFSTPKRRWPGTHLPNSPRVIRIAKSTPILVFFHHYAMGVAGGRSDGGFGIIRTFFCDFGVEPPLTPDSKIFRPRLPPPLHISMVILRICSLEV